MSSAAAISRALAPSRSATISRMASAFETVAAPPWESLPSLWSGVSPAQA